MIYNQSQKAFQRAQKLIPGGVNSPVRAFKSVKLTPPFISHAKGSRIYDVDGNEYIDYVGSWGPMILGHGHEAVIEAVKRAAERGTSFGAPTEGEVELAQMIVDAFPSMDMVRMVNSGTEAVMSAVRLARAYTGRSLIVKFEGCYHGHSDGLLTKAGSGALTHGEPSSPGVTKATISDTINLSYNSMEQIELVFKERGDAIAAVIVEPIAGNMGVVLPKTGFLERLREITRRNGALLIFDEVMTGFRIAYGGVQTLYSIAPDITCLAKIIGGGLPAGAYGGRKDIMEMVSPVGPVYQAGTLSGNPIAVAAGLATLKTLQSDSSIYDRLDQTARTLETGLRDAARKSGIPVCLNRVGSMLSMFFQTGPVYDLDTAKESNTDVFANYFKNMLDQGIYLPPSQFESIFISIAHTSDDITQTIQAFGTGGQVSCPTFGTEGQAPCPTCP